MPVVVARSNELEWGRVGPSRHIYDATLDLD